MSEVRRDPRTGEHLVWSVMDNAWITWSHWCWINGRSNCRETR